MSGQQGERFIPCGDEMLGQQGDRFVPCGDEMLGQQGDRFVPPLDLDYDESNRTETE